MRTLNEEERGLGSEISTSVHSSRTSMLAKNYEAKKLSSVNESPLSPGHFQVYEVINFIVATKIYIT